MLYIAHEKCVFLKNLQDKIWDTKYCLKAKGSEKKGNPHAENYLNFSFFQVVFMNEKHVEITNKNKSYKRRLEFIVQRSTQFYTN